MMTLIGKYFTGLTPRQRQQYEMLGDLYPEWNTKINVISRKDIDQLCLHHVLHSLSIARLITFLPGTTVMDAGCGGGFPGIPLAIMFPETHFTLVDSIGKKIRVIEAVVEATGLGNVTPVNGRFESVAGEFDFITGRAVTDLTQFALMLHTKIKQKGRNSIPNGILYLTGGDALPDLAGLRAKSAIHAIPEYFPEAYFSTKKLIHLHSFR